MIHFCVSQDIGPLGPLPPTKKKKEQKKKKKKKKLKKEKWHDAGATDGRKFMKTNKNSFFLRL